jgi:probable O-glycosylation ligase (exosortase A-associated)
LPSPKVRPELYVLVGACGLALVSAQIALNLPLRPALAVFVALLGGVGILVEPFLGILAYYVLAFMRPQEVFWGLGDTRLTALVAASTLVGAFLFFVRKPDFTFIRTKQNFFLALFFAWLYLSTIYGDFAGPEPKWMSYYAKMFLIYFIALAVIDSEKGLMWVAWTIAFSIGHLGVWANEMYFLNGWDRVHGPGEVGATFFDENGFATILVMGIPFQWYLMRNTRVWYLRLIMLALIPLNAHAVMTTFSRGGFLGLCITMAVITYREPNKRISAMMIIVGLLAFSLFAGQEYRARIGTIETYEEDASARSRFEAWDAGIKMATRNPFFGVGLKRFMPAYPYYSNTTPHVAHNTWVQIAAEVGFVAVFAYGMVVILTFRALFRIQRRLKYLPDAARQKIAPMVGMIEATLVGYFVCGFFLSMEDFEFFYVLVALVQISERITVQRLREAEEEAALAATLPDTVPATA